jgi:D-arabinose 1-dehydrogenase-like Zn-dependent alcohol dehydrogenase
MSIAVHALARAEVHPGQQVAVLGAGPIGLATVVAAAAAGARVMPPTRWPAGGPWPTSWGRENGLGTPR